MLPPTADSRLTHLLKTNTTISRIIEGRFFSFRIFSNQRFYDYNKEWRRKWQVGSQWLDADVEELYQDLHDIHAHVCFLLIDSILWFNSI